MGSRLRTLAMTSTLLLLLLPLSLAKPQVGGIEGFLDTSGGSLGGRTIGDRIKNLLASNPAIQGRVINSRLNPCQGQPPTQCSCTNVAVFSPTSLVSIHQGNTCGV